MVKDERTCTQLQEYLELGGKVMLERRFQKYLESKNEQHQQLQQKKQQQQQQQQQSKTLRGRGRGRGSNARGRGNKLVGNRGGKSPSSKEEYRQLLKTFQK